MSEDTNKTLWGIPIVIADAITPGTCILGPMPTYEDVVRHGSFENVVQAMAKQYAKITGLDDAVLDANEIS